MPNSTEYDVLSIEFGYSDDKERLDSSDNRRMHFIIRSNNSLAVLPECITGSTAGNVIYYVDPTHQDAVFHMKDLDGDWYPGAGA